jgi:hypothetical protein
MLRPSNSLLGSSRAARRANVRMERRKALSRALGAGAGLVGALVGTAFDLALLLGLPILYLASSFLVLDLPVRWATGRAQPVWTSGLMLAAAVVVSLIGVARAVQTAQPVAPVRPEFAKLMLGLSWVAALLLTMGDLAVI